MENQIKKIEKVEKEKTEIVNMKIARAYIIAETAKTILLLVNEYKVWISKKFVWVDNYTLNARIGIIKDSEYEGIDNANDAVSIPSNLLIEMIKSSPAFISSKDDEKSNVEL